MLIKGKKEEEEINNFYSFKDSSIFNLEFGVCWVYVKIVLSSLKLEVIFKSLVNVKIDSSQSFCNIEWL